MKIKLFQTENEYFNQKIADFMKDLGGQHEKNIAAQTISFILNNYPETQLFLRGEKVGETSQEIRGT